MHGASLSFVACVSQISFFQSATPFLPRLAGCTGPPVLPCLGRLSGAPPLFHDVRLPRSAKEKNMMSNLISKSENIVQYRESVSNSSLLLQSFLPFLKDKFTFCKKIFKCTSFLQVKTEHYFYIAVFNLFQTSDVNRTSLEFRWLYLDNACSRRHHPGTVCSPSGWTAFTCSLFGLFGPTGRPE